MVPIIEPMSSKVCSFSISADRNDEAVSFSYTLYVNRPSALAGAVSAGTSVTEAPVR